MNAWRDLRKLPRELWILCLATLVNRLGNMALPFLVLYLTRGLGFSALSAGGTLALFGVVALLVGPIAGRLADRWGSLRMMEATLVANGVVILLFPLAHSWLAVQLMTILFAVANEAFRPANLSLVSALGSAENRKSAFALNRLAVNLGSSVGAAAGGFLAQVWFPLLFIVNGLTTLAAAAVLVFSSFHPVVKAREDDLAVQKSINSSSNRAPQASLLGVFLSDADFRVFLLGILPVSIVFFQHTSAMPLFLVGDLHFSESTFGLLFTLNTLMIVAMEIPLNAATAHWPHRRTLALGSILFALGFGALALAETHLEVALTVAIWTFGEMILFPGMSAYVADMAPSGRSGEYMGFYLMTFSLAFTTGPWLGTFALERFGPQVLWVSMLVLGLLSAASLSRTKRPIHSPTTPSLNA